MSAPVKLATAPPEEQFWEKWSPHHEFPLSTLGAFALHIVLIGLFVLYISKLMNNDDDKTPVPIRPMAVLGDDADGADGQAGSGGGEPKEAVDPNQRPMDPVPFVPETSLQEAKPIIATWAPELAQNPDDIKTFTQVPNLDKLAKLNDELRQQLAKGLGGGKGSGDQGGKGDTGEAGKGDGGKGDANSTARRSLRWTLQFTTQSGKDYLDQLAAMKAILIVPQPPDWRTARVFRDLTTLAGEPIADISTIKGMPFIDDRPESVAAVAEALGMGRPAPPQFIAFFPKETEDELGRLEKRYRDRNPADIISTTFKIIVRDGKYTVTVIDQKSRR